MKKIVAAFLAAIMIFAVSSPSLAVSVKGNEYPIIMVNGARGDSIYDADGNKVFQFDLDKELLSEQVKECLPYFAYAVTTGNYRPWLDMACDVLLQYYGPLVLDHDGNPQYGTHVKFSYNKNHVQPGGNSVYDYYFGYDWRLDTCYTAELLNDYINAIIDSTGCGKVSLIGRCYGSNIVLAYLTKYGCEKVDTTVFYVASANGSYISDAFFANEVDVDPVALENFLRDGSFLNDVENIEDAANIIGFFNVLNGFDYPMSYIVDFFNKIYANAAPEILLTMYGGYPSFWGMISPDKYEKARAFVFSGKEEEYAGFLEKTDYYHYNVQLKAEETIRACMDNGMAFATISKYNIANVPVSESAMYTGDDTVEAYKSSYGATTAKHGEVLSDKYLSTTDMKYVSSDHQIDASTCLFKDSAWFIKDASHLTSPDCIYQLMAAICNYDGQMTVFDDEAYPQYLKYDSSTQTLSALTDEPTEKTTAKESFFSKLTAFIRSMLNFLRLLFKNTAK